VTAEAAAAPEAILEVVGFDDAGVDWISCQARRERKAGSALG